MTWTWTPLMLGLAIVWGIFTIGLIILLIYRSTLTMHEDEALYLDEASAHMQQEQTELLVKVNRSRSGFSARVPECCCWCSPACSSIRA